MLAGAELAVFSPLSEDGGGNTNSDDSRLSLTTQLLPQPSSQVTANCN